MKIIVFGAGYVGLVTSTCLAEMGNSVICIDNDEEKITKLNQSQIPIFEPGLSELVSLNINKRLSFTSNIESALKDCEIVFLTVGTPEDKNGDPILDNLFSVAKDIGDNIIDNCIIIQKSTAPPFRASSTRVSDPVRTVT